MIKRYISLSLIGCFALAASVKAKDSVYLYDKLLTAIDESNVLVVKKLLRRIDDINEQDKKTLIAVAQDAVETQGKSITLLKSPGDLGLCIGGVALTSVGILSAVGSAILFIDKHKLKNYKGASFLAGVAALGLSSGLYCTFKGWSCPRASKRRLAAETIEGILEAVVPSKKK